MGWLGHKRVWSPEFGSATRIATPPRGPEERDPDHSEPLSRTLAGRVGPGAAQTLPFGSDVPILSGDRATPREPYRTPVPNRTNSGVWTRIRPREPPEGGRGSEHQQVEERPRRSTPPRGPSGVASPGATPPTGDRVPRGGEHTYADPTRQDARGWPAEVSTIGYWPTAIIAPPEEQRDLSAQRRTRYLHCQACVTREAELIEREAAIASEEKRLSNWQDSSTSTPRTSSCAATSSTASSRTSRRARKNWPSSSPGSRACSARSVRTSRCAAILLCLPSPPAAPGPIVPRRVRVGLRPGAPDAPSDRWRGTPTTRRQHAEALPNTRPGS